MGFLKSPLTPSPQFTSQPWIVDDTDQYTDQNSRQSRPSKPSGLSLQFLSEDPLAAAKNGLIDPSQIEIHSNMNGNNYSMGHYGMGNGAIGDDELESLLEADAFTNFNGDGFGGNMSADQGAFFNASNTGAQQNMSAQHIYSNTPIEAPIRSPFANNFDYQQYGQHQSLPIQQQYGSMPVATGMQRKVLERQTSDSRSPMTPHIHGLHIGTPDSLSQQAMLNQQAKNASNQWNGTPGSGSWIESPLASPNPHHLHHAQIADIMGAHKHGASVPTKLEGAHSASLPSFQTQEAKKKRRRESHNLVERRRRDNINERIQDLSRLVPLHRLEDEKVRKHLNSNGPLSPSGVSPPQATSLLAGPNGRRATAGNITQGLPQEEKEKGPNKGDILNGAVAWMRDCMWMLYLKDQQQQALVRQIESMGGSAQMQHTDEEERMISELRNAVERNGRDNFAYSRAQGTGLRVPDFTNWAGDPLDDIKGDIRIKQDPGSVDSDMWFTHDDSGRNSLSIKEEDELGMDMG